MWSSSKDGIPLTQCSVETDGLDGHRYLHAVKPVRYYFTGPSSEWERDSRMAKALREKEEKKREEDGAMAE